MNQPSRASLAFPSQALVVFASGGTSECMALCDVLASADLADVRFISTTTAAETHAALATTQPVVVIVHHTIPGGGLALLKDARQQHGQAGTWIMLVAAGDVAGAVAALKSGADECLACDNQLAALLPPVVAAAIHVSAASRGSSVYASDAVHVRLVLDATRMTMWEWDLSSNHVHWSRELDVDHAIGAATVGEDFARLLKYSHPDDMAIVQQQFTQGLTSGTIYEIEHRMLLPNRPMEWYFTFGQVICDAAGIPLRAVGASIDITARKQAEQALRESEERYRALITATSQEVWRADQDGHILTVEPAKRGSTTIHVPPESGWEWLEWVHPDDREHVLAMWRQALAGHTGYAYEYRALEHGEYRHLRGYAVPVFAADGSVREWIGTHTDVTDIRLAEAALRRREAEFKALIDNSPDIITRFDRDLRHLYVSPAVTRITGLPTEAFIGKTNQELGMPDDLVAFWVERHQHVLTTGQQAQVEFSFASPSGTRFFEAIMLPERTNDGTIVSILSIARDITERKKAEDHLRFLANASRVLQSSLEANVALERLARLAIPYLGDICIIDVLHGQRQISTVVCAHVDPAKEALLWEIRRTFAPTWNNAHPVSQVLQSFQPQLVEDGGLALDGLVVEERHKQVSALLGPQSLMRVPFMSRGQPAGVISLSSARTTRVYTTDDLALAEELAQCISTALENARLYQDMQDALRERDAFLSIISHETRNMLTGLIGRAELLHARLEQSASNPRNLRDIQIIMDQSRSITTLLDDMVRSSSVTRLAFVPERVAVDLQALVAQVVSNTQLAAAATTHVITVQPAAQPLIVAGDSVRLEQVFTNLLSNAIKYSFDGGTITIALSTSANQAVVAVTDDGIGIPAAALPKVFQRFYRVPRESAPLVSGSGIGLFVVQEIVAAHGGSVQVASVEGRGSTFTVLLPLME